MNESLFCVLCHLKTLIVSCICIKSELDSLAGSLTKVTISIKYFWNHFYFQGSVYSFFIFTIRSNIKPELLTRCIRLILFYKSLPLYRVVPSPSHEYLNAQCTSIGTIRRSHKPYRSQLRARIWTYCMRSGYLHLCIWSYILQGE